jgi:F-type H+-transporting ATPase subunit b
MIKKVFFQSIFLSFLRLKEAFAAEKSGMPQLNPEFWISQTFWLVLTFGMLYILLSKLILPKISKNLETRKSQILENIEAAEKQREESEQKIKDYNKIINDGKTEAKNYFSQAREKILKDINKKKEGLENDINDEINKAEIEIQNFKKKSSEKINKIAIETSANLIHQLLGVEINNSSISAIVKDLSKKNKNKYYDN